MIRVAPPRLFTQFNALPPLRPQLPLALHDAEDEPIAAVEDAAAAVAPEAGAMVPVAEAAVGAIVPAAAASPDHSAIVVARQGLELSDAARAAVGELIAKQAFSENNHFIDSLRMDNVHHATVKELSRLGVISCRPDDFGGMEFALVLANVKIEGVTRCCQPCLFVASKPRAQPLM